MKKLKQHSSSIWEDDWKFFTPKKYITKCIDVLSSNVQIGQCLINRNYAETSGDVNIIGGILKHTNRGAKILYSRIYLK